MESKQAVGKTEFQTLPLKGRGKVRDIYDLGDKLLMVATDRISAFDVVLPMTPPGSGQKTITKQGGLRRVLISST